MSEPGYDLRTRTTRRLPYGVFAQANATDFQQGHSWLREQRTISYRDRVEGERLTPQEVDPYNGFLVEDSSFNSFQEYLNPNHHLLSKLEAAGLAEPTDYEVKGFVDTGHPFETVSHEVNTSLRGARAYRDAISSTTVRVHNGSPFYAVGAQVRDYGAMPFPMGGSSSAFQRTFRPSERIPATFGDLQNDGKKLLLLATPGRPEVDVTQFVLELLGNVPAIPGRAIVQLRSLSAGGDEWLNVLFGIIPTVGDGIELALALRDLSSRLLKYRRKAGKITRRRRSFPLQRNAVIFDSADLQQQGRIYCGSGFGFNSVHYGGYQSSNAQQVKDLEKSNVGGSKSTLFMLQEREVSFAGAFTYYLPTAPAFWGRMGQYAAELDRVLGLKLDPTTAWQLAPWSWLIDWFFDIKEMLSLMSVNRDENLVIRYGYAMETIRRTAVQTTTMAWQDPVYKIPNRVSTVNTTTVKRRVRANPYGFVTSTESLGWDPYKLSVLAALGISRRK